MYCNQDNCTKAQDYIEITLLKITQRLFLKDLERENKWISKKIEFQISKETDKNTKVKNIQK